MKLGVICDGISRDLAHAVDVMDEFDLDYAELQFIGDKEVGDHSVTLNLHADVKMAILLAVIAEEG